MTKEFVMRCLRFVALLAAASASALAAQHSRIVVVLDRSGSMAKLGRMPWAVASVQGMVACADSGTRLALIAFDDHVEDVTQGLVELAPGPDGHRLRRRLMRTVGELAPRGSTDILAAMAHAIALGADEIVLATDGEQTQAFGGRAADAIDTAQVVRDQLARGAVGVRVFTIGIGAQADARILRAYATASDGAFFQVQDAADLLDTFTEIGRLISGAFVCAGDTVSVFPGDRQLKLFLHAQAALTQAPVLAGAAGDTALVDGPALFAAEVGELHVFNFDVSPSPGAYRVRCPAGAVRVLTEKRAPYRFVLAPIAAARANLPLEISARIERLEADAVLPDAGDVRFELGFDQGARAQAARFAGPCTMTQVGADTFVWRGFLRGDHSPEGSYNVRLVGNVAGWQAGDVAAFRVLPAVAAASIVAPAGSDDLGAKAPGERVEISFDIERQGWPADLSLRVETAPPAIVAADAARWTWSFVAPSTSGDHQVEVMFTAPGAVLNGGDGGWTFRTRVHVVEPVVALRLPAGHAFPSLPGSLPLEVIVPPGSPPVRMRISTSPDPTDAGARVTLDAAAGKVGDVWTALAPGSTRLSLRADASLSCPPGPFADTLHVLVEPANVRVQIDDADTSDFDVTGVVAPIDARATLTDAEGAALSAIAVRRRAAAGEPAPAFAVHFDAASVADPDLAAGLAAGFELELEHMALRLRVLERAATVLRFALDVGSGVRPGVHRGVLRVTHASPRVRLAPPCFAVELDVPQPTLAVTVWHDGRPVEKPIVLWAPLLADFHRGPPAVRLAGIRLRAAASGGDPLALWVGTPFVRPIAEAGVADPGDPTADHVVQPNVPVDLALPDLGLAPGDGVVDIPLRVDPAAAVAADPLTYAAGRLLVSVRVRVVPARAIAGGLLLLGMLLYLWHRARNPGVSLSLGLVRAPEGGYFVVPHGLLHAGESVRVRGGRFVSRRRVRIAPGARISPGRGDSGGARLCLRRVRGDHWLLRRAGDPERVFVRRGGARLTEPRVQLRDGDVLVLGAYEVALRMASAPLRPAPTRHPLPPRRPTRPPMRVAPVHSGPAPAPRAASTGRPAAARPPRGPRGGSARTTG